MAEYVTCTTGVGYCSHALCQQAHREAHMRTKERYRTHGDPYSDPPRARVCTACGALVGDEVQHERWHMAHG